jgi:hypothetical protein
MIKRQNDFLKILNHFVDKLFCIMLFIRWVACPANALSRPGFLSVGKFFKNFLVVACPR